MNKLTPQQLSELQQRVDSILTDDYFNRFDNIPIEEHVDKWDWRRKDFARLMSLIEFEKDTKTLSPKKILTFNGRNDPEMSCINSECEDWCNLDHTEGFDLHNLDLLDQFDFAMLNQTIEHLYDPLRCLRNIAGCVKPGGLFYMNFPINNLPHREPHHFSTGITLMGATTLLAMAGFEMFTCGQWGNVQYLKRMMEEETWVTFDEMIYSDTYNERICPIIGWVFARKL